MATKGLRDPSHVEEGIGCYRLTGIDVALAKPPRQYDLAALDDADGHAGETVGVDHLLYEGHQLLLDGAGQSKEPMK